MNANDTIFAIALASNLNPEQHLIKAFQTIATWGDVDFSSQYLIPCRDGIGADYWNSACILKSGMTLEVLLQKLEALEQASGRIRPSHQISLDVDLIAWGTSFSDMQFNPKKLPLALDVKIPMFDVWQDARFQHLVHNYPKMQCNVSVH